jgi:di/tricarboxylate transporter
MHGVVTASDVSKQALGNALAGVLFLIVAIVDVTRDSSGIGVVFLVFVLSFWVWPSQARTSGTARPRTCTDLTAPNRI